MNEFEIYQKVRRYIKDNRLILEKDIVLIGLSGGADSIAMTDMLLRMSQEENWTVQAIHVHHGIRGEEADRDLNSVIRFCKDRKIPLEVYHYNIPEIAAEKHLGIEEAGRMCREAAFLDSMQKKQCEGSVRIALAHNQNDQAETVLHHLARGTGLRGMCGILPQNDRKIRPVLCLERTEIEKYCEERNLVYVTDSTNIGNHYTRNRIRHEILPLMEKEVHGRVTAHIAKLADQLQQTNAYMEMQAQKLLEKESADESTVVLSDTFFKEPEILCSYAVFGALEKLAGKRKDIASVHVEKIMELAAGKTGRKISLPYQLMAERINGGVKICHQEGTGTAAADAQAKASCMKEKWRLVPGEQLVCRLGVFDSELIAYQGDKIEENKYTKWFDYDKIKNDLIVRTREAGDFLTIHKNGTAKKLKRYFIDEKVPAEMRRKVPLLVCGSEVLWVVGGRISESYKISSQTQRVLRVTYKRGDLS